MMDYPETCWKPPETSRGGHIIFGQFVIITTTVYTPVCTMVEKDSNCKILPVLQYINFSVIQILNKYFFEDVCVQFKDFQRS